MSRSRILLALSALVPVALAAFALASALQPTVANAALSWHGGPGKTATPYVTNNPLMTSLPYATQTPWATRPQWAPRTVMPNWSMTPRPVMTPHMTDVHTGDPCCGNNNMGNWNRQSGGQRNDPHPMGGHAGDQNHHDRHDGGWHH